MTTLHKPIHKHQWRYRATLEGISRQKVCKGCGMVEKIIHRKGAYL